MATDNGLNRYDGYSFDVFYHSETDSTSISSNIVRVIEEDENGDLWIGTFNGLNRFNKATQQFEHFLALPEINPRRLDVQQMVLDSNGRIWFSNLEAVGWFDISSSTFHFLDIKQKPNSIAINDSNEFWLRTQSGNLFKFDSTSQKLSEIQRDPQNEVAIIHFGNYSKSLWLSKALEQGALSTKVLPTLPDGLKPYVAEEIDINRLLIGTESGLFLFNEEQETINKVSLGASTSVLSESVKSIFKDDTGAIWVGTLNGVYHFNPYRKPFEHLDVLANQSDVAMGMVEFENDMLINTLGKGLYRYHNANGSITALNFRNSPPAGYNFIWSIEKVPNTSFPVWLATNAGVILYNPDTGDWRHLDLPSNQSDSPPVFAIHKNAQGHLWVANSKEVYEVSINGKLIRKLDGVPAIRSITQDLAQYGNQLFLATDAGLMSVIDLKAQSSKPLSAYNEKAAVLKNSPIWDLYLLGHTLWIGTNKGLFKYNIETFDFQKVELNNQGRNNIIFSIAPSINDELWLGTEAGLLRYDLFDGTVRKYDQTDGLENYEFNRKSVVLDNKQRLWFGGVSGVSHFDPKQINENPVYPPVYISSVNIISKDTAYTERISSQAEITLPWHQNTLEFDFVALNFSNPAQNRYQYQLEGYEPDWVHTVGKKRVRYVQLPPGSYDFMVKGANNDGLWNPEASTLKINILPPYWKTIWFQTIVVLAIAAVLWLIYRYRVRRLLEIERLKLRIAGDLHDEVGSGLSSIALSGDILQQQIDAGRPKPELVSRITGNARYLASSLDDIVWLIDPQKETLEDFINRVKSISRELLPGSTFNLEEEIRPDKLALALNGEVKRNLYLLCKEALHNIAKHARASQVDLSLKHTENRLLLRITDNGGGFDLSQKSDGHGLSSMRKRAEELKGKLQIKSIPDQGTTISFKMKLP